MANHDRPRGRAADRGAPVIAEALTGLADVALRRGDAAGAALAGIAAD